MKLLLENGVELDLDKTLLWTVKSQYEGITRLLLEKGIKPDFKDGDS